MRQFGIVELQIRLIIMPIGQTGQRLFTICDNWVDCRSCQIKSNYQIQKTVRFRPLVQWIPGKYPPLRWASLDGSIFCSVSLFFLSFFSVHQNRIGIDHFTSLVTTLNWIEFACVCETIRCFSRSMVFVRKIYCFWIDSSCFHSHSMHSHISVDAACEHFFPIFFFGKKVNLILLGQNINWRHLKNRLI